VNQPEWVNSKKEIKEKKRSRGRGGGREGEEKETGG
jgi:hypothetical protein